MHLGPHFPGVVICRFPTYCGLWLPLSGFHAFLFPDRAGACLYPPGRREHGSQHFSVGAWITSANPSDGFARWRAETSTDVPTGVFLRGVHVRPIPQTLTLADGAPPMVHLLCKRYVRMDIHDSCPTRRSPMMCTLWKSYSGDGV